MSLISKKDPVEGPLDNMNYVKLQKKYLGFWKNLSDDCTEYPRNTEIYGFRYIGDKQRSLTEKLCWLILFCTSGYFCTNFLYKTWVKWNQSPILVRFAQSPTPVWNIPFPAITICPETKVKQTKYNFTENYHKVIDYLSEKVNMADEELQRFSDISLFCNNQPYSSEKLTTSFRTVEYFKEIAPQLNEIFINCKWVNSKQNCTDLFSPILTEDGICFTFNMLDYRELYTNAVYLADDFITPREPTEGWNIENGYPKHSPEDTFPRRAMSAGAKAGMFLLLRAYEQDLDYVCRGPVQGFKIMLHNPTEVPPVATHYFPAPLNRDVVVIIKPDMMTTSPSLRNYDPYQRQCFFSNERRLLFFKTYTQQNCQVECAANYTLARCGCVPYHMPIYGTPEICDSGSTVCVAEAEEEILSGTEMSQLQDGNCNCLPACTSITYNVETSQADFNWRLLFRTFKSYVNESPEIQLTRLTIFFKDMQFITSERNGLYDQTDLLPYCGGLLELLFTGLSFLSIIGIIYFLSLRLMCNVHKFGKRYWSGSEKLSNNDAYLHERTLHF